MMHEADLAYHFGMETSMTEGASIFAPRKLTRQQARMEQLVYWSRKSIPDQLAAATALTRRRFHS